MADAKVREIRIYKATKTIVASILDTFLPGLTGTDILEITSGGDSTFPWQFVILGTVSNPHAEVVQEDIKKIDVTSAFIVTELIHLLDNTITVDQLLSVQIPESDPTNIWFTIRIS